MVHICHTQYCNTMLYRCCSTTILLPWSHTRNASQQQCAGWLVFQLSLHTGASFTCFDAPKIQHCSVFSGMRHILENEHFITYWIKNIADNSFCSHRTPVKRSDDKTLQNTGCVLYTERLRDQTLAKLLVKPLDLQVSHGLWKDRNTPPPLTMTQVPLSKAPWGSSATHSVTLHALL